MVKSRAYSSPYQSNSYINTYATPVKSEECFWNWRIIVTSYSGLQIRWDASRKIGRFKINIRPPADFHLHNRCWASAYQLLCGWKDRFFRLILLVLLATSKGYSEDYLRKNDATTIVLTSNSDSTYKAQRRYWEIAMIVLPMRKAACSVYCLTMAQHCPLPGQ